VRHPIKKRTRPGPLDDQHLPYELLQRAVSGCVHGSVLPRSAADLALASTCGSSVAQTPQPLLDALDRLCFEVDGDPDVERDFYGANTPQEMVDLAVEAGIFIDADDFRALLTSGETEFWMIRGDDQTNPIAHMQRVFRV
jgi:hypothetical protein